MVHTIYHKLSIPKTYHTFLLLRILKETTLEMATKAGNGILESEIVRGISIPLPEFQLEYVVEAELHIEFALMLPKKRGEKTQSEIADKLNISYQ
ncbi:hypothetical protein [Treponema sp. OMZ 906]|uniref:hypothetical protein n=1 Tax=Treponema sp. OMZ 906 TaxID=2563662 RepID=UPI0020A3E371|nr:hypothetical protein [Treponema sp. OMZ 906]